MRSARSQNSVRSPNRRALGSRERARTHSRERKIDAGPSAAPSVFVLCADVLSSVAQMQKTVVVAVTRSQIVPKRCAGACVSFVRVRSNTRCVCGLPESTCRRRDGVRIGRSEVPRAKANSGVCQVDRTRERGSSKSTACTTNEREDLDGGSHDDPEDTTCETRPRKRLATRRYNKRKNYTRKFQAHDETEARCAASCVSQTFLVPRVRLHASALLTPESTIAGMCDRRHGAHLSVNERRPLDRQTATDRRGRRCCLSRARARKREKNARFFYK